MTTNRLFVLLTTFSLLLVLSDRAYGIYFSAPRDITQKMFQPILFGLHDLGLKSFQTLDFFSNLPNLYHENQSLQLKLSELAHLELDNQKLKEENQALRNQLTILGTSDQRLLPARVLGEVTLGSKVFLLINQGKLAGVSEQSVVVLEKNLVGKVVYSSQTRSRVLPIFSSDSEVSVKVGNGTIQGKAVGELNSQVVLTQILQEDRIAVGDLITTSGAEGIFPPDLLIGKVGEIRSQDWEVYQKAKIDLFWRLKDLNTVFVVF